jgi:ubiquinone/menaquinone biosynthesis C-methylase UbiE
MVQFDPDNRTRKRYNRIAFLYDFMEAPLEWMRFSNWRKRLQAGIKGERALEVGVGTGKNLAYYPEDVRLLPGRCARNRDRFEPTDVGAGAQKGR